MQNKAFPEVKFLAHSGSFDIAYDSVLDLSEKYKATRTLALEDDMAHNISNAPLSPQSQICKDTSYLPQYFILRYNHPDNLLYKKVLKWFDAPYVWYEGEKIKLLPYKQVIQNIYSHVFIVFYSSKLASIGEEGVHTV